MADGMVRRVCCGVVAGLMLTLAAGSVLAVTPDEILPNKGLEARARALSHNLRCLVCQNQSIDDSDAPLARDLRRVVRERLTVGDTDAQVVDFIVQRYGDFVLLTPPFRADTLLLWLTPVLVLLGGAWLVTRTLGAHDGKAVQLSKENLSADEEARLTAILDAAADDRPPSV